VVGHALVAINVRASAAAHLSRREQPVSPVAALEEIASTSAEALGELRAALKGLRSDESEVAPLRPAGAGLADLGDLIAGVKGAELTVELEMAAGLAVSFPTRSAVPSMLRRSEQNNGAPGRVWSARRGCIRGWRTEPPMRSTVVSSNRRSQGRRH
jgi:Histidine kinase